MLICPSCASENDDSAENCFGCGRGLYSLKRGDIVAGRYEIIRLLGKGGMGLVYKAADRGLDNDIVAIKVLRPDVASSPSMAKRFRTEIRLARRVRHKNVCGIHEYGEHGHLHYIVMDFVEGVDLKQVLKESGALPCDLAFQTAIQIAEGLQAVHEAGIVHRDLKTPNIMRDSRGLIRLMDFGIAKSFEGDGSTGATGTGQILGTPEYMSPEQVRAEKLDGRSDIYALGIVIYELFTGTVPFRGDTPVATLFKHLQDAPAFDGAPGERLPIALRPVLERALAKNREDRFQSAQELVDVLRETRSLCAPVPVLPPSSHGALARDLAPFPDLEGRPTPVPTVAPTHVVTAVHTKVVPAAEDTTVAGAASDTPPTAVIPKAGDAHAVKAGEVIAAQAEAGSGRAADGHAVRRASRGRVLAVAAIAVGMAFAALWLLYARQGATRSTPVASSAGTETLSASPPPPPLTTTVGPPPQQSSAAIQRPTRALQARVGNSGTPAPGTTVNVPPLETQAGGRGRLISPVPVESLGVSSSASTSPTEATTSPGSIPTTLPVGESPQDRLPNVAPPPLATAAPQPKGESTPPQGVATGTLSFRLKPAADIAVDGAPASRTFRFNLPAGPHTFVFLHPDYLPLRRVINVKAGEVATIAIDLRDEAMRRPH